MSQFGMQMPGGQLQRGPSMNIYTGLLALAVAGLLVACVYVGLVQGPKVSPTGQAWDLQQTGVDAKGDPNIKFAK